VALVASLEAVAQPAGCRLSASGSVRVQRVVDAATLVLDDGREVRLAGIVVPASPGPTPEAPGAALAASAKAALETLVTGQAIVLKGDQSADRHGRLVAHVFVTGEGLERWVQQAMLALGLVRVGAQVGDRACAADLWGHERRARDAKLGLWADPGHAVRRAEEPAAVLADRGRFTLVEGLVLSVRESGGTIYVNFGRRWSEDFTVTIAKRNEGMFTAAGVAPKRLERRRVRIRGWIEERGGPWIDASHPEQVEVLERN
jgi:endonuclease YncB( thermonuclease family)